ncbi:hypothetical protein DPQ22_04250 [Candidatus Tokpelaia sp.]|nr:hypothetical protein DPQ22_04250 [Candidatus Tokpelaia sp.]
MQRVSIMVWYSWFCTRFVNRHNFALAGQKQNIVTAQKPAPRKLYCQIKARLWAALLLLSFMLGGSLQTAQAQIGVGFTDNGTYTGTVGANKGAVAGFRCPNGGVIRGYRHTDKSVPYPPMGATAGMTIRIDIYCNLVTMDKDKVARAYPTTPDDEPAVDGTSGYAGAGAVQSAYCPADQVVNRTGGDSRKSTSIYPAWASDITFTCAKLTVLTGDWVAVQDIGTTPNYRAGNIENNLWTHNFSGWICAPAQNRAVNGIYRQNGGEGWDGFNIYCATVRQARFSSRIQFQNFAWKKTLGPDGWLTDLTKNGVPLESQIVDPATGEISTVSGRDKMPYSNFEGTDNDPAQFQYDYEIFVLPGTGYGATLSQRPGDIPEASYSATSNCISTVALADHQDATCDLLVTGRPDIGVSVSVSGEHFTDTDNQKNVTVAGVSLGPTQARGTAGFSLEVDIPAGWTPQAVPGCTVSGQHVSCAIATNLAEAADFGEEGGTASFTFPITVNANAQLGQFDIAASLGRSRPDAGGNILDSDYNTDNDKATTQISFDKRPAITLTKISLGGTGQFTFSGDNGWQSQTLATDVAGTAKTGKQQVLTTPLAPTTITETPPQGTNPAFNWTIANLDCTGLGEDGSYTVDGNSFTLDQSATNYNAEINCTVTNQLATTRTAKSSDLGNNTPVQNGDEIVYTLTTDVIGNATIKDTVLTDILDDSVEFVDIEDAGDFQADTSNAPALSFTLPSGTAVGSYSISYRVRVKGTAADAVKNSVTSDNGYCDACETQNPLVQVSTTKKSSSGNGNPVGAGDIITYTLTTTVTGGATTSPVVLTDAPSDNLEFVGVTNAGSFTTDISDPTRPQFTLPEGTPAGIYQITYQVKVNADTTSAASNSVTSIPGTCDQCSTSSPVVSLRVNKSSDVGTGTLVQNGDIITYRLSVTVTGGFTLRDTVLTDTLGDGLTFQKVSSAGRFRSDTGKAPVLAFTLPKGTPAGTYTISYTAQVKNDASGTVANNVTTSDGTCETCATENPVITIASEKTSMPAPGTPLQPGDIITYTLTTHITGGTSTTPITLNDTLGGGLAFQSVTSAGSFTADTGKAPQLKFTLPKGMPAGDYQVSYSARIKDDATTDQANNIVSTPGTCTSCTVTTPLIHVDTVKSSDIPAGTGVQTGDFITYTLTTTVSGGTTTKDTVFTDKLGTGLSFDSITDSGSFTNDTGAAPTLTFTLPAGTEAGTYTASYRVKVEDTATGALNNAITPGSGGSCSSCSTTTPLTDIVTEKTVDVASGTPVRPGDILTYSLTVTVKNAPTTRDLNLADSLGDSLSFDSIADSGAFTSDTGAAPQLKFVLPAGTAAGTYKVSYRAKVKDDATLAANNAATSDYGSCSPCTTTNPLMIISTAKSSDIGAGKPVQKGDIITYTLTMTVAGSPAMQAVQLTDTLGSGLDFVAVANAGQFTPDTNARPVLKFTLPAGTAEGTYKVSYTARVNSDAVSSVQNSVTSKPLDNSGNPVDGVELPCNPCTSTNPLTTITTAKSSDVGAGAPVQTGDIITYTLKVDVAGGTTTQATLLTDTLGDSLEFVSVTNAGAFTANTGDTKNLKFTLPAGTAAGSYTVSYTARVKKTATTAAQNSVTAQPLDNNGNPVDGVELPCDPCTTQNPLVTVTATKSANIAEGSPVQKGDIITYSVTAIVSGGATTQNTLLTDTLSSSLDFVAISANGGFTADTGAAPQLKFTLPKGTAPGTYIVSYTAQVKTDAKTGAKNTVIAQPADESGNPTKDPNAGEIPCNPCTTNNPLFGISIAKTANIADGAAVRKGEILTYTLTSTVAGIATTQATLLTDTLGAELEFIAVTDSGSYSADVSDPGNLKFTLPKGTQPGLYKVSYTVRVKQDAQIGADNSIAPQALDDSGTPVDGVEVPCEPCSTQNPLGDISIAKSSDIGSGTAVQKGDIITYSLTVTVIGGATARDTLLTDTLGDSLDFVAVTSAGSFTADTGDTKNLKFTLPKGATAGTYTVSYTARVKNAATGSAQNAVTPQILDDTGTPITGIDIPCDPCSTQNPLIDVSSAKSSDVGTGTAVRKGDIITYTLTVTITGGTSTQNMLVSDTLSDSLEFVAVSDSGSFTADTGAAQNPKFTLPKGTAPGTYTVSYTARVKQSGETTAKNEILVKPADDSGTPVSDIDIPCDPCSTESPIIGATAAKTSDIGDGVAVQKGDIVTYNLTVTVTGGATANNTLLTDTLNSNLEFVAVTNAGSFTADTSKAPQLQFTLPKGTPAGTYTVSYTARVKTDAQSAAQNSVTAQPTDDNGDPITDPNSQITCNPCTTQNPLATIDAAKSSDIGNGVSVQTGQLITYTLTAHVTGGTSTQATLLTDTLGDSLEFVAVTNAGSFTADTGDTKNLKFTLPKGTPAGTYTISYTARVKEDAIAAADNSVTASPLDNSGTPVENVTIPCNPCATQNPLVTLSTAKTSDIGDGTPAQKGDIITYTLTTTVKGGATTQTVNLTDTLGDSLAFDKIVDAGAFTTDTGAQPALKFSLPQGTPAGTYTISYTARITGTATKAAQNNVVSDSGTCDPCTTQNPLITLSTAKTSDIGDGTGVQQGDIITYSLTVNVTGGATTQTTLLTDTLGDSLDFVEFGDAGDFTTDSSALPALKFILPAGTKAGSHIITYKARVKSDAQADALNNVTAQPADANGNPLTGTDVPQIPCDPCTTTNPLVEIATAKTSDVGTGNAVQQGDLITYSLTVNVTGGATTRATLLTDTLGDSLDFVEFGDAGDFTADSSALPALKFILPKGTKAGSHIITYKARVKENAVDLARNSVTAQPADDSGQPIDDPNIPAIPCIPCETQNPLVIINTSKTSDIGTGNPMQSGEIITYRLTTIISGGTSTNDIVLTDTLGENVQFVSIKAAGSFTADTKAAPVLNFTLPKGTPAGTYVITYQAKAKDGIKSGVAENSVTTNQGSCAPCATQNPIVVISTVKTSDIGTGTPVQPGDTITYTLTTTVAGGVSTKAVTLTDTLGSSLDFSGLVAAGRFTADTSAAPKLAFTLPAGMAAGTYQVSYKVKVKGQATADAVNNVTTDNGSCDPCTTQNPLIGVRAQKSSDVGDGTAVQTGDIITYTLQAVVANGQSTQNILLTDTLGESLDFIAVKDGGRFTADLSDKKQPKFLLPPGQAPGIYTVSYTARVKADATIAAQNAITAQAADNSGKPITGPDAPLIPCDPCTTQNPLISIMANKTSNIGDGNAVGRGDLITYTINVSVTGGATTRNTLLTDTLNSSLDFVKIVNAGSFKTDVSAAPVLSFTLPKGTPEGFYPIIYQARAKTDATAAAQNTVTAQGADDDGNPLTGEDAPQISCDPCTTQNPLVGVSVAKDSTIGDGTYVQRGDIITYRLKVDVTGGKTTRNILLTDTMNSSLEYMAQVDCGTAFPTAGKKAAETMAATAAGAEFTAAAGQIYTATIPAGTAAGQSSVCYQALVLETATLTAQNSVKPQYTDSQGRPVNDSNLPAIPCDPCTTQNPLVDVLVSKRSSVPAGESVQRGDIITYTLQLEVKGGNTTQNVVLTDTLGDNLEFVEDVPGDGAIMYDAASVPPVLSFSAYHGLQPGIYSVSYTARVKSDAVGTADNQVIAAGQAVDKDGQPILDSQMPGVPCNPCATTAPIDFGVSLEKNLIAEDGAVAGVAEPGETLTYEITITNRGGAITDYAAQDILDTNVTYLESDPAAAHDGSAKGGTVEWTGLTLPARQDGANGVLKLTVKTKVIAPVDEQALSVFNMVKEKGAADPDCSGKRKTTAADDGLNTEATTDRQCVTIPLGKPRLSLNKTVSYEDSDGSGSANAGDILHYSFEVSNDGSVPLENVTIEDNGPKFNNFAANGSLGAMTPANVKLAVGEKATIKADYILTDADVENSLGLIDAVVNTASARGRLTNAAGGEDDPLTSVASTEDQAKLTLAAPRQELTISKVAGIRAIRRGEQVPYTIRLTNNGTRAVNNVRVVDRAPSGFRFVEHSAGVDAQAVDPLVEGRNVIFENITLAPGAAVEIHLNMLALSSATPDKYTNRAHAEDEAGNRLTDDAKATVEILVEHVFDCSDVIGTVFDDYNRNGYQDEGEIGLPDIRLATAKGWIITTDTFGRYHIPCAALPESRIGSNFILKLDTRSLPSGYRLTTENPRVVRLTAGKLTKINFGASVSRVVRLDLRSDAFEAGTTNLKAEWNSGIAELIEVLEREQSVLRLSYIDSNVGAGAAQSRINHVQQLIRRIWGQKAGRYRLEIETRVEVGG